MSARWQPLSDTANEKILEWPLRDLACERNANGDPLGAGKRFSHIGATSAGRWLMFVARYYSLSASSIHIPRDGNEFWLSQPLLKRTTPRNSDSSAFLVAVGIQKKSVRIPAEKIESLFILRDNA